MTYFPQEIMTKILEYCDDRVEQRQRQLWNSISVIRVDIVNYDGTTECISYSTLKPTKMKGFTQVVEWGEYDRYEDGFGECLVDVLESDEFWDNAMTNDSYRQHRRYKLSNFGKKQ